MTLRAWQYGLLPPLAGRGDPADWGRDCEDEMRRQTDLWNQLVEIESRRRERDRVILLDGRSELAELWSEFDRVIAEHDGLRRPPHMPRDRESRPAWEAEVAALRERARELRRRRHAIWLKLKPMIAAARRDSRDELRASLDQRYAEITEARQQSGLWWGNYNAVCAAFDTALGKLEPGDELRHQEFSGAGRLTNQLQGGAPAAALLQGGHAQVRIDPLPAEPIMIRRFRGIAALNPMTRKRGDKPRAEVRLLYATVYSARGAGRRLAVWPIVLHRPFPPGAVVKTVAIHRRRVGAPLALPEGMPGNPADWRWTATFVLDIPDDPELRPASGFCGVDVGWRILPDREVRVATVAGSDGALFHINLASAWFERREGIAKAYGAAAPLRDSVDPDERRHYAEYRHAVAHGLDRRQRGRREHYRIAAKEIAERYGAVVIDTTNIAQLGRRQGLSDRAPDLPPQTRRMRAWAAPAELVAEIGRAVKARGGTVTLAAGQTTRRCHFCGHDNSNAKRDELVWVCEGCRAAWDQDENAARLILLTYFGSAPASGAGAVKLSARSAKPPRVRLTRKSNRSKNGLQPVVPAS
ncbi:MAG TPA: hypothetical protein VGF07_13275 [Stellaceae bacterium]